MKSYLIVQVEREWRVVETVPGWPSRIACRSWSETRAQAWLINQLAEINMMNLMRWAAETDEARQTIIMQCTAA
jgi:hypothetical protein